MSTRRKTASGGARLKAAGRKPVLLGLEPSDWQTVADAAKAERRPVTQFFVFHGLEAAKKILKKQAAGLDS